MKIKFFLFPHLGKKIFKGLTLVFWSNMNYKVLSFQFIQKEKFVTIEIRILCKNWRMEIFLEIIFIRCINFFKFFFLIIVNVVT